MKRCEECERWRRTFWWCVVSLAGAMALVGADVVWVVGYWMGWWHGR